MEQVKLFEKPEIDCMSMVEIAKYLIDNHSIEETKEKFNL